MEAMMKKMILAAVLALLVLCGSMSVVFAQETSSALKIGVVDLYRAVNDSEQGKKAKADLEATIKSKQEALESKGRAIEKLRSDLEKQGDVLSADAKKNKADEYERLTREYQRNMADSQNEVRKKEAELTGRIMKSIREVVLQIAQQGKYSLILERAEGLVLAADPSLDITDTVISQVDSSSPSKPKKKK
jgi:outer membrane protein